jgi:hypothetical protein
MAETILTESGKHTPDPRAFARAKKYADKACQSKRFDSMNRNRTGDGLPIKRFRVPGESIIGTLGEARSEWAGETTIPFVLDDGRVIALPGNRRLQKAIQKAKATFLRVKITYLNKLRTNAGHFEKVYRLELAPLGKEGVGKTGRALVEQAATEAQS